ncbi:MAG: DUF2865 domain-containing protein [Pseudomonadota bacterium]
MNRLSGKRLAWGATALLCVSVLAPAAQAQDFFSQLFGGFGRAREPQIRIPFGNEGEMLSQREPRSRSYGGGQAYCVRTCDGRYFPVNGPDNASRAESCNSFCPASDTKLVYGSSIDNAATENGKAYSELPNAFRYRTELVAGCTCNGKDQIGLAPVKIDDDPTLRKGDIVAGEAGLMVAGRPDRRGASLNFSPASDRIQARYQRVPVLARE